MNKKVLPIILGATITSLLITGCNNTNTPNINKERIANTSNLSEDEDVSKIITSGNVEEIIAHNHFQIISHDEILDLDKLEYKINLVFQNTSKATLNDIKVKYSFNVEGYSKEENFEQTSIQAGENIEKTFTISIKDVIDNYYNNEFSKDDIYYNEIISNWKDRDKENFKYSYSYLDKEGSTVQIDSVFSNQWSVENSLLTIKK